MHCKIFAETVSY